jgi:hypothetical protein
MKRLINILKRVRLIAILPCLVTLFLHTRADATVGVSPGVTCSNCRFSSMEVAPHFKISYTGGNIESSVCKTATEKAWAKAYPESGRVKQNVFLNSEHSVFFKNTTSDVQVYRFAYRITSVNLDYTAVCQCVVAPGTCFGSVAWWKDMATLYDRPGEYLVDAISAVAGGTNVEARDRAPVHITGF